MNCLLPALVTVLYIISAAAKQGSLIMFPRNFELDSNNTIKIKLFDVKGVCDVSITATSLSNLKPFTQISVIERADLQTEFNTFIPKKSVEFGKGIIEVNVTCMDGFSSSGSNFVNFKWNDTHIILLQTDKPFYKPGDSVKFRVVYLDEHLRPLSKPKSATVEIEGPKGSIKAQWTGLKIRSISEFVYNISEYARTGTYKIICKVEDHSSYDVKEIAFDVKEELHSTFEVDLDLPDYVLADENIIPVKLCANYFYGKEVKGAVKIETFYFPLESNAIDTHEEKIDGCMDYKINISSRIMEELPKLLQISSSKIANNTPLFFEVSATFIEKGTGMTWTEKKQIIQATVPLQMEFKMPNSFKQGLPFNGKVLMTLPDDTPALGEECEICFKVIHERVYMDWFSTKQVRNCRNFTADVNGQVEFAMSPQNSAVFEMYIEARSVHFPEPSLFLHGVKISKTLRPYIYPHGSSIQLIPEDDPIPCETVPTIGFLFIAKNPGKLKFFCELTSKAKLVKSYIVEGNTSYSTLSSTVPEDIWKKLNDPHKLVNAVTEIILPTESKILISNKTMNQTPESNMLDEQHLPAVGYASINIGLDFDPSGAFYFLVHFEDDGYVIADALRYEVDKCFTNKVDIYETKVRLKKNSSVSFNIQDDSFETEIMVKLRAAPHSLCSLKVMDKYLFEIDFNDQFQKEKIFQALEKMEVRDHYITHFCQNGNSNKSTTGESITYEDSLTAFQVSGSVAISNLFVYHRPCIGVNDTEDVPSILPYKGLAKKLSENQLSHNFGRFYDNWMFDMIEFGESGTYSVNKSVYYEPAEWKATAVCVSSVGLGISDNRILFGKQQFIMEFNPLPHSVFKGEIIPSFLLFYNNHTNAVAVNVSLEIKSGSAVINESINGEYCIPAYSEHILKFNIQNTTGDVLDLRVKAGTSKYPKKICESQEINPSVFDESYAARYRTSPTFVVIKTDGGLKRKIQRILFVSDRNDSSDPKSVYSGKMEQALPDKMVQDSTPKAALSVSGDIMGPVIRSLQSVSPISGCGLQNMVKFTCNIYILDYLSATGNISDDVKKSILEKLRLGGKKQGTFRHKDGYYSAFGGEPDPSTFLTAFVIRSYTLARAHVPINDKNLDESIAWIVKQVSNSGCVTENGTNLHAGFEDGLSHAVDNNRNGPLTAFVFTSLVIAGYKESSFLEKALKCIEENVDADRPYTLALYAHAYGSAIHFHDDNNNEYKEKCKKYIALLFAKAKKSEDMVYFENEKGSRSINIETAAYAVLAILQCEDNAVEKATPVMRWLVANGDPDGGWHSPVDMFVRFLAAAMYSLAAAVYSESSSLNAEDLKIEITGTVTETVEINTQNRNKMFGYNINSLPVDIQFQVSGTGVALMQLETIYHTHSYPPNNLFDISAQLKCSSYSGPFLEICTRYLSKGETSNMAILEIQLASGIVPNKKSLDSLVKEEGPLKSYLIRVDKVILYFDELSNDKMCLKIEMIKKVRIDNYKQVFVKVFDYYETDNFAITEYSAEDCT